MYSAEIDLPYLAQTTWLDARGDVIGRTTTTLDLYTRPHRG